MNKESYTNRQRANFRAIEAELYNYSSSLKELTEWKNEIYQMSGGSQDIRVQSSPGNQTLSKVLQIFGDKEREEQEKRIKAIQKTMVRLKELNPEILRLMELKYFIREHSDRYICKEANVSEATFYRWRRYIVCLIAAELGWRV